MTIYTIPLEAMGEQQDKEATHRGFKLVVKDLPLPITPECGNASWLTCKFGLDELNKLHTAKERQAMCVNLIQLFTSIMWIQSTASESSVVLHPPGDDQDPPESQSN